MDRRLRLTLTFAFAGHLLAALGFLKVPVRIPPPAIPTNVDPIEVWSGRDEVIGQEQSVSSIATPTLRPVLRATRQGAGSGAPSAGSEAVGEIGGSDVVTTGDGTTASPVMLFQPTTATPIALAGQAPNQFTDVPIGIPQPSKKILAEGPHGTEGPVLTALHDAAHGSLAPNRGHATFRAVIDETGTVVDVRLVDTSGDEQGWKDAREKALQALRGRKLASARKCEMDILVTSDIRLPSGNAVGKPITPKFEESYIPASPNAPGAMAPAVAARTLAEFDVTDIGAKGARVVHTRLVRFVPL